MPITVRHDPSTEAIAATAFAGAAAQAGREDVQAQLNRSAQMSQTAARIGASRDMQAQQLRQQREMQMEQIEAAADRQRQAADDAMARTAMQYGLSEQIKEDEFDRQLTGMREQARIEAQQFEYEFTTKQRQEIARLNNADELVQNDPRFSEEDRQQWNVDYARKLAGITPRARPRDPNKPTFEPGQGPGQPFANELTKGAVLTTTIGPSGQPELKVLVRPDQTVEYMREEAERATELKQLELKVREADARRKRIEEVRKFRYELTKAAEEAGKPLDGWEIDRRTIERFGGQQIAEFRGQDLQQQETSTTEQLEQELQRRLDTVKQAKAFLKKAEEKYKDVETIPPEMLTVILRANEIVKQFGRDR